MGERDQRAPHRLAKRLINGLHSIANYSQIGWAVGPRGELF
jgi:hypothetical protein